MSDNQISINNLSKVYDNGFKALDNVSLKIKQGEIIAGKKVATIKDKNNNDCKMNGENNSLDTNTPTSKLFEKSGKGNNKNPKIKPIIIAI